MQLSYLKRSVGLVTAATYVIATGILTSVTLGSVKLINNAKVAELVKEMAFYDNANAKFVGRYNALPGLLSYSKCMTFPEFSKNCRRQDDINLTTNEYIYKGSGCSATIGCTLQNNGTDGKQAGEDVFRNFLLPMRYLKDAGLGYVKTIGLSKQLFSTENLTKQTWAESKAGDGIYVNIYNYYNVSGFGEYFLFNNNSIMGHTTSSDKAFDHYDKLMEGDNQYLVYHRFGDKRGALSVQNVKALDIKIDDGKPMTGRLTTYSTDNFSGNFAKSEYSKCITAEPSSYDVLKSIDYNIDTKTGGGYCNFTYQLKNVAEMVNNNTEITKVGTYTPKDTYKKCTKYSDEGEVCYKATSCHYEGIKRCCKFEDHSTSCYDPSKACYFDESKKRCCKYGDTTLRCESSNTWEFKNGKCVFKYYDNSTKEEDYASKISNCTSSTSCTPNDNGNKLCNYCRDQLVANSCVDKKEYYCTKNDNLDNNECTNSISWTSNYYCSFLGNIKTECKGIIDKYCPASNSQLSVCSDSTTATTTAYCRFVDGNNNNTGYCANVETKYCATETDYNQCTDTPQNNTTQKCIFVDKINSDCSAIDKEPLYCPSYNSSYNLCKERKADGGNYLCVFIERTKIDTCTASLYCPNDNPQQTECSASFERNSRYACQWVDNAFNTCRQLPLRYMYCPQENSAYEGLCRPSYTLSQDEQEKFCKQGYCYDNVNEYSKYYCIFQNLSKNTGICDEIKTQNCSTNTAGATCNTTTPNYTCKTVNNQIIDGTCISNSKTVYCPTNNPNTDSGCDASVSATNHYKCTFVAGTSIGDCVEQTETKYCSSKDPSKDTNCTTSADTTNYYECKFVAGNRSGNCTDMRETKYCSENNPNYSSDCTDTLNITYKYECNFINKQKITCTQRNVKMQFCGKLVNSCIGYEGRERNKCSTDAAFWEFDVSGYGYWITPCTELVYCVTVDNSPLNYKQCSSTCICSLLSKQNGGRCDETYTITCEYGNFTGTYEEKSSYNGPCLIRPGETRSYYCKSTHR